MLDEEFGVGGVEKRVFVFRFWLLALKPLHGLVGKGFVLAERDVRAVDQRLVSVILAHGSTISPVPA